MNCRIMQSVLGDRSQVREQPPWLGFTKAQFQYTRGGLACPLYGIKRKSSGDHTTDLLAVIVNDPCTSKVIHQSRSISYPVQASAPLQESTSTTFTSCPAREQIRWRGFNTPPGSSCPDQRQPQTFVVFEPCSPYSCESRSQPSPTCLEP